MMARVVLVHRDSVIHLGAIAILHGAVPVRLPVRLICEVARYGRTSRGPGCVTIESCTDAGEAVTCAACVAAATAYRRPSVVDHVLYGGLVHGSRRVTLGGTIPQSLGWHLCTKTLHLQAPVSIVPDDITCMSCLVAQVRQ